MSASVCPSAKTSWLLFVVLKNIGHALYRLLVDEKGSGDQKKAVSDGFDEGQLKHLYLRLISWPKYLAKDSSQACALGEMKGLLAGPLRYGRGEATEFFVTLSNDACVLHYTSGAIPTAESSWRTLRIWCLVLKNLQN
ncbi:MAG: hypothetical protein WBH22_11030 [Pseudomonas mandelii]|uniref:hypothetical protein n=1 Tax=Pseudomonas mandelii TaxID=75612 RepID=UPI003C73C41F